MKKVITCLMMSLMIIMGSSMSVNAQEQQPFEGEILMETYENYSDYIKKMGNSIFFDGVHKIRVIVKGCKLHYIDETTKCHYVITDADAVERISKEGANKDDKKKGGTYVHFCELTKSGLDFTSMAGTQGPLVPWKFINAGNTDAPVSTYTFKATDTKKTINGKECTLYEGDINHTMGGMDQKYFVQAYVSDIPAPKAYPWALYGLQIPNIAMKWVQKYDGGHVSVMSVGELSFYIEYDVTEIKPRAVSDDEFVVPSDYKIANPKNVLAMMKYYKGVKKQLEKLGIKGGDKSEKTTGVHYKTDGSWDF